MSEHEMTSTAKNGSEANDGRLANDITAPVPHDHAYNFGYLDEQTKRMIRRLLRYAMKRGRWAFGCRLVRLG